MKWLFMCEGPNEREVINILLEHHCLEVSEDDLLGLGDCERTVLRFGCDRL